MAVKRHHGHGNSNWDWLTVSEVQSVIAMTGSMAACRQTWYWIGLRVLYMDWQAAGMCM